MKKYFQDCHTIEDVKRTYKEWAKKLHPDNGGSEEEFKAMAAEYEKAFERLKSVHASKDGGTYEEESQEVPEEFAGIINACIAFENVKIEIIGSWVWLTGNTFVYKDIIKDLGFFWSKSKKAWYYTGETEKSFKRGHYSMDGVRQKWGTTEVKAAGEERRKIS